MIEALFGALVVGGVVVSRVFGLILERNRRIRGALRSLRTSAIRDVEDGRVAKIAGKLELLGPPLMSPITKRPCALYYLEISEGHGKNLKVLAREQQGRNFAVRDATGRAVVVPANATVSVVIDGCRSTGVWSAPSPEIQEILRRLGLPPLGGSFRYEEGVLEHGTGVAVGGLARWEPDPDAPPAAGAAFRETARRLVLQASGEMPLFISDDPSTLR